MSMLVGTWNLLSWTQKYDDGRELKPFGEQVIGRLSYDASGNFSVLITRRDREPFRTGGQWTASDQEKAAAYDAMLAYFGNYEIDGTRVLHHVQASLYPNWSGHTQTRNARLDGETLTLSARLEENTREARTAELVWNRLPS